MKKILVILKPSKSSVIMWLLNGIAAIFIIGIILYLLVIRDTWKIDNYLDLSKKISDTNRLYYMGKYDEYLQEYEGLQELIGYRELRNEKLINDYIDLQEKCQLSKNKIKLEEERIVKKRVEAEEKRYAKEKANAEKKRIASEKLVAERKRVDSERAEAEWKKEIAKCKPLLRQINTDAIVKFQKKQTIDDSGSMQEIEDAISDALVRGFNRELHAPSTAKLHPKFTYQQIQYEELSSKSKEMLRIINGKPNENTFYRVMGKIDAQNLYGATLTKMWIYEVAITTQNNQLSSVGLEVFF